MTIAINMRGVKLRNFEIDVGSDRQMLQELPWGQYNTHTLHSVKHRYQINTSIDTSVSSLTGPEMGSYLDSSIVPLINSDFQPFIKKHVYCLSLSIIASNCALEVY